MNNLINILSKQREKAVKNGDKLLLLNVSVKELTEIITGLKMNEAFDRVLDEEIKIKDNRRKNK